VHPLKNVSILGNSSQLVPSACHEYHSSVQLGESLDYRMLMGASTYLVHIETEIPALARSALPDSICLRYSG